MWKEKFPRVHLASLPTPLEKLERVSNDLQGIELYIKRDDLTGLAYGGNKVRKLEYLMGEGHRQGCRTVITLGGPQSNHARMTAAAASKMGWEAILVLEGEPPPEEQGNILLDGLLGARIVWTGAEERSDVFHRVEEELRQKDKKFLSIPLGGSNARGALGYLQAAEEIGQAQEKLGVNFDYIVAGAGSGGTHSGLLVGKYMYDLPARIMGIAAADRDLTPTVDELFQETSRLLGQEFSRDKDDLFLSRDYVGPGYGLVDEPTIQAVRYLALQEGIIVGPVYTGKALAGLLDLALQGFFPEGSRVLFIHTGGTPEVFAFNKEVGGGNNAKE